MPIDWMMKTTTWQKNTKKKKKKLKELSVLKKQKEKKNPFIKLSDLENIFISGVQL